MGWLSTVKKKKHCTYWYIGRLALQQMYGTESVVLRRCSTRGAIRAQVAELHGQTTYKCWDLLVLMDYRTSFVCSYNMLHHRSTTVGHHHGVAHGKIASYGWCNPNFYLRWHTSGDVCTVCVSRSTNVLQLLKFGAKLSMTCWRGEFVPWCRVRCELLSCSKK